MIERRLIVGGDEVSITNYPFIVQLFTNYDQFADCGGSLISERFVLTAAHCVDGKTGVEVGTYHRTVLRDETGDCADMIDATVITHPEYETYLQGNDLALLELSKSPACWGEPNGPRSVALDDGSFWPRTEIAPIPKAMALGWGKDAANGLRSLNLKGVEVNLYTSHQCAHVYQMVLAETNRCSGTFPDNGADSCTGDSGGPLVVEYNGSFVQVGVVSWGYGDPVCADGRFPGVYNTISGYDHFFSQATPIHATYNHSLNNATDLDCSCTVAAPSCVSGNANIERCGCSEWNVDEKPFCYMKDPALCPSALKSLLHLSAAWLFCTPLSNTPVLTSGTDPVTAPVTAPVTVPLITVSELPESETDHAHAGGDHMHAEEELYLGTVWLYIFFAMIMVSGFFIVIEPFYYYSSGPRPKPYRRKYRRLSQQPPPPPPPPEEEPIVDAPRTFSDTRLSERPETARESSPRRPF